MSKYFKYIWIIFIPQMIWAAVIFLSSDYFGVEEQVIINILFKISATVLFLIYAYKVQDWAAKKMTDDYNRLTVVFAQLLPLIILLGLALFIYLLGSFFGFRLSPSLYMMVKPFILSLLGVNLFVVGVVINRGLIRALINQDKFEAHADDNWNVENNKFRVYGSLVISIISFSMALLGTFTDVHISQRSSQSIQTINNMVMTEDLKYPDYFGGVYTTDYRDDILENKDSYGLIYLASYDDTGKPGDDDEGLKKYYTEEKKDGDGAEDSSSKDSSLKAWTAYAQPSDEDSYEDDMDDEDAWNDDEDFEEGDGVSDYDIDEDYDEDEMGSAVVVMITKMPDQKVINYMRKVAKKGDFTLVAKHCKYSKQYLVDTASQIHRKITEKRETDPNSPLVRESESLAYTGLVHVSDELNRVVIEDSTYEARAEFKNMFGKNQAIKHMTPYSGLMPIEDYLSDEDEEY